LADKPAIESGCALLAVDADFARFRDFRQNHSLA
jgi:hypothetical protein